MGSSVGFTVGSAPFHSITFSSHELTEIMRPAAMTGIYILLVFMS